MTAPVLETRMTAPVLETRGLCMNFGALMVTRDVHFQLAPGARHALIGPNGAGKTTFINLITGVLAPSAGQVLLAGEDITGLAQAGRVKRGIARTFQINTLFRGLSVLENVFLAVAERRGASRDILRPVGRQRAVIEECMSLLDRLGLASDAGNRVDELPYGRQRLVEIAIALGLQPRVLLLDEPAAGVPSAESGMIFEAVETLSQDIAVLIIEHDMDLVFRFAKEITVLVNGGILKAGAPAEIANDPEVRAVYLGEVSHV